MSGGKSETRCVTTFSPEAKEVTDFPIEIMMPAPSDPGTIPFCMARPFAPCQNVRCDFKGKNGVRLWDDR